MNKYIHTCSFQLGDFWDSMLIFQGVHPAQLFHLSPTWIALACCGAFFLAKGNLEMVNSPFLMTSWSRNCKKAVQKSNSHDEIRFHTSRGDQWQINLSLGLKIPTIHLPVRPGRFITQKKTKCNIPYRWTTLSTSNISYLQSWSRNHVY